MVPSDSSILSEYQGVTGIPEKLWALMGHKGVGEGRPQGGAPPKAVRIGLGGGGAAPSFLSLSLSFPPPPSWNRKGNPTRIGNPSWTPPLALPPWPPASSFPSFIYVARGHPKGTTIILSRVRCPPPQFTTSVILS